MDSMNGRKRRAFVNWRVSKDFVYFDLVPEYIGCREMGAKVFTYLSDHYKEDSNMYFDKLVETKTELMKANLKISRLQGQIDELKEDK